MSMVQEIVNALLLSPSRGFYYRVVIDQGLDSVFLVDTDDPEARRLTNTRLKISVNEAISKIGECQILTLPPLSREYTVTEEEREEEEGRSVKSGGIVHRLVKFLLSLSEGGQRQRRVTYTQSRTVIGLGRVEHCDGRVKIVPEKSRDLARMVIVMNVGPREAKSISELVTYAMSDTCPTTVMRFLIPDKTARPYTVYRIDSVVDIPEVVYAEPTAFKFEEASILTYTDPVTGIQHHIVVGRVETVKDEVTGKTYITLIPYVTRSTFLSLIIGTSLYRTLVGDLMKLKETVDVLERLLNMVKESGTDPDLVKKIEDVLTYIKAKFGQIADAVSLMSRPHMLTIESLRTFVTCLMHGMSRIREMYGDMFFSEILAIMEDSARRSEVLRLLGDLTALRNIVLIEQLAQRQHVGAASQQQLATLPTSIHHAGIGQSLLAFQPPPHLPQVQQQLQQTLQIAQAQTQQQQQTTQQDIGTLLAHIMMKLDKVAKEVEELKEKSRTGTELGFTTGQETPTERI